MSRSTVSTFQLFERFPDEPTARVYRRKRSWRAGRNRRVAGFLSVMRMVCPERQSNGRRSEEKQGGAYALSPVKTATTKPGNGASRYGDKQSASTSRHRVMLTIAGSYQR
jgi:hypothetical protein